jgi:hypothetical protein
MGDSRRILLFWIAGLALGAISLHLLPSAEGTFAGYASNAVQYLMFLIAVAIVRREPTGKNRAIFVNFAVFFGTTILFHLSFFAGYAFLTSDPYTRLYVTQYLSLGGYFFLLAVAVVYVAVDALFRDFRMIHKYLLTLLIVGSFFAVYYGPLLTEPTHLLRTETALNFKELEDSYLALVKSEGRVPAPEELSAASNLHSWNDGNSVGVLYPEERLRRVQSLYPYLHGSNYIILLMTPLYKNVMFMNVLCIGFILLFFGYQYRKDPPQGAYLDKIMFLLLVLCSTEVLHAWSFTKSAEWGTFAELFEVGQYVSLPILTVIAGFFLLRLRWICSVNGEFYEVEITERPTGVTRWRDWVDELVLSSFFNRKAILGRLFERTDADRAG